MSMLTSLARSPSMKSLLALVDKAGLPEDWEDPKSANITAHVSGRILDNKNGDQQLVDSKVNDEYLVHIHHRTGTCVVNLNNILALACAYAREEYEKIRQHLSDRDEKVER